MTGLTLVSMSTRVASGDGPASAAPEQAEERRIRGDVYHHPRLSQC